VRCILFQTEFSASIHTPKGNQKFIKLFWVPSCQHCSADTNPSISPRTTHIKTQTKKIPLSKTKTETKKVYHPALQAGMLWKGLTTSIVCIVTMHERIASLIHD